ncbi:AfsR/SARP family transcriptional regulator [Actinoalloteichus hymeniacidonis]|uniref:Transcriptional regulatory protein,putative transcriptional regulator n=1 Tax=Actinoalloteichus hymeniacidonis TaxID=340345 RepID=A0AAC9MXY1_9PSEU|nr:AfsR/SARP family transcriptional regulator [Actinoalloteichus hymeniacidonis]AOS63823.1 transcriptional regulatory protein,putative transcriptional regulator [Actinoalloteichus hymeniacidonis]MBB5908122.1 DNA-binding SARP family transcriptional activator [Actinoalloteichus hymeniacidonis]
MTSSIRFGVLGPLVAEEERGPVDLKGPRHRAVVARLLVAKGRVVPRDLLIDDLWETPPSGAVGAVQTFIATLRRSLEPDRPPRTPARLLVTVASGYALRAEPDAVDAGRFESEVARSRELLEHHRAAAALDRLDTALGWWRGPAYSEFADAGWAREAIANLDELRLLAVEQRAEALSALGRAAEAVPSLEAELAQQPWRESSWRLLALTLYRAGRQGDALGVLRRARRLLVEDLGVDPGPALRQIESDILAHAPHLSTVPAPAVVRIVEPAPASPDSELIGRGTETGALTAESTAVHTKRQRGVALVSGEAGAGKTALVESFTERLGAEGWIVAWGRNPDHEGVPAAWPWHRILDTLAATGTTPVPAPLIDTADPKAARFRWHRAIGDFLVRIAQDTPLALVLDDLHWADTETLALLAAMVTEPLPAPILLIATYRTTEVSGELTELLGRVARTEPARIYLTGLAAEEVSELVNRLLRRTVDAATAGTIHRRSGGNPFFVRELARLLDTEGLEGLSAVPWGVRAVVQHRMGSAPEAVRTLLRHASVLGSDLDLDLLRAMSADADLLLDAAEDAARRGFLVELGPGRFRFAHSLVRDTVYEDISRSRRAHWHGIAAAAIERARPIEVEALAEHFRLAENPATVDRVVHYARLAAENAESRYESHRAAWFWRTALTAYEQSPAGDVRLRLALSMGLVRTLAVTGDLAEARRYRAEAITLVEDLNDPEAIAEVIVSFDVPAIWPDNDDPALAARIATIAQETLPVLPSGRTALRARLLATIAVELRSAGGARGRQAACEAEELARELGDPALLAFALNARFLQSFERAGLAPSRVRIGRELVEVARANGLVSYEVLGHLVLIQAHAALADLVAADRHTEIVDRLGVDYQIPLVGVFTDWYRALRCTIQDAVPDAIVRYRAAAARLVGTGMAGLDEGILGFALYCTQFAHAGAEPRTDAACDCGPYRPWCRPALQPDAYQRNAATRADGAARVAVPDSPRDLLFEARTCLQAMHAIASGDRPTMQRLATELAPAAEELAGAGSGLLTLRPVAWYLGELAIALGRPAEAEQHYRHALTVAERAGSASWATAARDALSSLDHSADAPGRDD